MWSVVLRDWYPVNSWKRRGKPLSLESLMDQVCWRGHFSALVRAKTSKSFLLLSFVMLMLKRWIGLKSVSWFAASVQPLFFYFYHWKLIYSEKGLGPDVANIWKMVHICHLLATCCNSTDLSRFVGILCGTIAGKKKKKMMYLTAKNAGQDTLNVVDFYLMSLASFSFIG